ncbi:MAG: class II aldolase/adducin family protein [Candidatus Omnitrophica bacterium]|nr:class II aldolase/adducin family protein [Candidatus Omnitrophota bacterium]MBU1923272.1 class II aldolase/adducin family protein [Candidatus Omnitrophota bacterium]
MYFGQERQLKKELINTGRKIYNLGLVAGTSGNLSARLDKNNIFITATGTAMGDLKSNEIIKVDLANPEDLKDKRLSSEFPLHRLIYENLPNKVIIHCHPALANGYFAVYSDIKALTFETKLYLGQVPVIPQETPAVTNPKEVVEALKSSNLVVLKNHGVVCIADDFKGALHLIENLEEAVRTISIARLFKKDILDDLDKTLKDNLIAQNIYPMFSKEHIQAIVDLVNKDEFIKRKGEELDLTLQLAIKLDGSGQSHKFTFEKGRITKLEPDDNCAFVISAPAEIWELVFLGKLDSFVAVTQGKMKLKGELGKLSRWYVPFSRLFELFKQVRIK